MLSLCQIGTSAVVSIGLTVLSVFSNVISNHILKWLKLVIVYRSLDCWITLFFRAMCNESKATLRHWFQCKSVGSFKLQLIITVLLKSIIFFFLLIFLPLFDRQ